MYCAYKVWGYRLTSQSVFVIHVFLLSRGVFLVIGIVQEVTAFNCTPIHGAARQRLLVQLTVGNYGVRS